jgi:hypothetical protein
VPPDGDLFALKREDSAEQVRILIPRRQAQSGAPNGTSSGASSGASNGR